MNLSVRAVLSRPMATLIAAFTMLAGVTPHPVSAADNQVESAIVAGQVKKIWSTKLGEERRLLIALPNHYEQSDRSYPVLYLLDANEQFLNAAASVQTLSSAWVERMPETIIVGIVNTERTRDFRPKLPQPVSTSAQSVPKPTQPGPPQKTFAAD